MIRIFGISLLIIISFAKEYFISFRFSSLNSLLINQNFICTEALIKHSCKRKFAFAIEVDSEFKCENYKEKIIEKLIRSQVIITSFQEKINNSYYFKETLIYPPKLFDIIIKDDVAYFYECKE